MSVSKTKYAKYQIPNISYGFHALTNRKLPPREMFEAVVPSHPISEGQATSPLVWQSTSVEAECRIINNRNIEDRFNSSTHQSEDINRVCSFLFPEYVLLITAPIARQISQARVNYSYLIEINNTRL